MNERKARPAAMTVPLRRECAPDKISTWNGNQIEGDILINKMLNLNSLMDEMGDNICL